MALPTGFGKSLIYQVPSMILKRPAIVVSPLIFLMADQERALRSRGDLLSYSTPDCVRVSVASRLSGSKAAAASLPSRRETLKSRATAAFFELARPSALLMSKRLAGGRLERAPRSI